MRYLFKIMLLVGIMFTGCVSACEPENDLQPSNIRLLFGSDGASNPVTLIEFVDPYDFRVVTIGLLSHRWPQGEEDSNYRRQNIYGMSLLEDFFTNVPLIEHVVVDLHRRYVVQDVAMQLSSEQLQDILTLVDNVVNNNADREFDLDMFSFGRTPYVWAIINGDVYWSFFDRGDMFCHHGHPQEHLIEYANLDLLELSYKLIDLSPATVVDNGLYQFAPRSRGDTGSQKDQRGRGHWSTTKRQG